jgi:hypothetical protein
VEQVSGGLSSPDLEPYKINWLHFCRVQRSGWQVKTLSDIAENLDSKRIPITKSKRTAGAVPYYGASGVVDYVDDFIFNERLLLISEDGANLIARTYLSRPV